MLLEFYEVDVKQKKKSMKKYNAWSFFHCAREETAAGNCDWGVWFFLEFFFSATLIFMNLNRYIGSLDGSFFCNLMSGASSIDVIQMSPHY